MKKLCLALLVMVILTGCKRGSSYSSTVKVPTCKGHHYLLFPVGNGYIPIHDPDCPNHKSDTIRILYKK